MASYSAPEAEQIEAWTGINVRSVPLEPEEFGQLLAELRELAESEVAQFTGEGRFDSTGLTARQAASLGEAVACGVAGRFLTHPQVRAVTGTRRPLIGIDPDAMAETAAELLRRSRNLARLVAQGGGTETGQVRSNTLGANCPSRRKFTRCGDLW